MLFCLTYSRGLRSFLTTRIAGQGVRVTDDSIEGKLFVEAETDDFEELPFAERCFCVIGFKKHDEGVNKRVVFNSLFGFLDSEALNTYVADVSRRTFRISVKTSGKWRKKIDSEKLSGSLSTALKKRLKLTPNLRNPAFELCVHITEKLLFVAIPKRSLLSRRPYHYHNGLRSTVCDAIIQLAELKSGHIVVDVTCGSGSILVEAAHAVLPESIFCIGLDCNEKMLLTAKENFVHCSPLFNHMSSFEVACVNASSGSLRWEAVDRIVADLPFGHQHGNVEEIKSVLLPEVFNLIRKFFSTDGKKVAVILIAEEHKSSFADFVKDLQDVAVEDHALFLGYTSAVIVKISRSG
ncbi:hypothetical protein QR680_005383 [Steinernema hermaphroditum]|uniref:Ribosomal RNA large subunit methyltransferase K/L-like methyltransferase domain-containing protein n=1 Tax=Steinernema hermaphroditum TaxID=289476 RepID=A0AA39HT15_9BILA|nr:hypothetical protein QR680_005383 [Steinernema hermaphroditum]